MAQIGKAAVIGAGVMGSAIAAHLANAGVPVVLMDIVPKGATNRNALAEGAIERLLTTDPQAFMHKKAAKWVTPANIEDHLELLSNADWILEAVVEDLPTKRSLYSRIDEVRKSGSVVSSNTSTLTLANLVEGLPERFANDFLILSFFQSTALYALAGSRSGPKTRPEAVQTLCSSLITISVKVSCFAMIHRVSLPTASEPSGSSALGGSGKSGTQY